MSKLSKYTVAHIHQVICNAHYPSVAAKKLKLTDSSILTSHLGKFLLYGEPLSVDILRMLSVEDARKLWGVGYTQKIDSCEININQYKPAHIHYLSRKTDSIRNLASLLGVRDHTVHRYLKKFEFHHKPLTFELLKSLSGEEALQVFGTNYEALYPAQRINLTPSILEKSIQLESETIIEQDDFSILAAQFKHDFPIDARVGEKRNMHELFSGPLLTDDSDENPFKQSRQESMVLEI
ncbi:MAG: hypothetical protein P1U36_06050 [Legionellaceae bacterium]|nr:hypothetical protein [Legionellaceae bacterium]